MVRSAYVKVPFQFEIRDVKLREIDINDALIKIKASLGPETALKKIKNEISKLLKDSKTKNKILGIGIGVPGPYFGSEGRIGLMTEFPGWDKVFIKNEFKSSFNIPIYFEHDANAAAIAEWWYGDYKRKLGTLFFIFVTEGVGSGIVIDGNLYKGNLGIAGEIGHTSVNIDGPECECGNNGCLENYCSTISIIKRVKNEIHNYPNSELNKNYSLGSILSAFISGDELAEKVIRNFAKYLSYGIVNIINYFNPKSIIIGGKIIKGGPKLLTILRDSVKKHLLSEIYDSTIIEFSSLKAREEVAMGASLIASNKVLKNPALINKTKIKNYLL